MSAFRALCFSLIALVLAACEQPAADALRFALQSAPINLDPRYAADAASTRINRLLYSQLVELDERGLPVPALADWQLLADRHYRLILRPDQSGRVFHDGTSLNSDDVKATYDSVLFGQVPSLHRETLKNVLRVDVFNEHTVDFHLKHADPFFPALLTVGILPKSLIETAHPFNTQPSGSGGFQLEAWPQAGRLQLRRRHDNQLFEFVTVPDPTVRVLKLLSGEVDMLQNDLPVELVRYLAAQEDVLLTQYEGTGFTYIGFNLEDAVTGQQSVRRAIAHAIDREAIIEHLFGGAARLANQILPATHWAGEPDLAFYPYQPERARQLMASLGYDQHKPLPIIYKTSADPFRLRIATIVQQQLREVGIDMQLQSYDWGTYFADIKAGRFQMYSLMWVGVNTPDIFRNVFHSKAQPPQGANRGRFHDVKVDEQLEAAASATTLAAQAQHYRNVQKRVHKQLPYVPLWYEDHIVAVRKDIHGYHLAADGNYDGLIEVYRQ